MMWLGYLVGTVAGILIGWKVTQFFYSVKLDAYKDELKAARKEIRRRKFVDSQRPEIRVEVWDRDLYEEFNNITFGGF